MNLNNRYIHEDESVKGHEVSFSNNDWILLCPWEHEIISNLFRSFL